MSALDAKSVRLVDGHWIYADTKDLRRGVEVRGVRALYDNKERLAQVEVTLKNNRLWLIPPHSVLFVEVEQ